jgi:hypothetical protein
MKWTMKNKPLFEWILKGVKDDVVYYNTHHKNFSDHDKLSAAIYSFPIGVRFDIAATNNKNHLNRMREIIEGIDAGTDY